MTHITIIYLCFIFGFAGCVIGLGIIAFGWKGFEKEGIPLPRNRRIKGRVGHVIGAIIVLAGFGTFSRGVAYMAMGSNLAWSPPSYRSGLADQTPPWQKTQSNLRDRNHGNASKQSSKQWELGRAKEKRSPAHARVDKAKAALHEVEREMRLWVGREEPPSSEFLDRVADVYREAVLAYAELDTKRADSLCKNAFQSLKSAVGDSPGNGEGKTRLVKFSVDTLGEIDAVEALPLLAEARRFAYELIEESDTVERRGDASNLAHDSAHANSNAGNSADAIVGDFRDALQHSYEAFTLASRKKSQRLQRFAIHLISRNYHCLARHYESVNEWSSVVRVANESLNYANDDAGALLRTSVHFAMASRNISNEQRKSNLLNKAKRTLQRAMDYGLTYEQVVESSHRKQVIASQPDLRRIIEPLVPKATRVGDSEK